KAPIQNKMNTLSRSKYIQRNYYEHNLHVMLAESSVTKMMKNFFNIHFQQVYHIDFMFQQSANLLASYGYIPRDLTMKSIKEYYVFDVAKLTLFLLSFSIQEFNNRNYELSSMEFEVNSMQQEEI